MDWERLVAAGSSVVQLCYGEIRKWERGRSDVCELCHTAWDGKCCWVARWVGELRCRWELVVRKWVLRRVLQRCGTLVGSGLW